MPVGPCAQQSLEKPSNPAMFFRPPLSVENENMSSCGEGTMECLQSPCAKNPIQRARVKSSPFQLLLDVPYRFLVIVLLLWIDARFLHCR